MLDHIHHMDRRMEAMSQALEAQGVMRHFEHDTDLDAVQLDPGTDGQVPVEPPEGPEQSGASA
jgi:serine O-acetyltransferase